MMTATDTPDPYATCVAILRPLWRGLDPDYKRKYSTTIWTQFEAAVVRAGHQESLSRAVTSLCARLPIAPLREGLDALVAGVRSGDDRALLRLWRTEATTLVLMLRVEAEEAREAAKAKTTAKRLQETEAWQARLDAQETQA